MELPKYVKVRPNFFLLPKGYRGITIWPFGIFIRRDDYSDMEKFINHEEIHWRQQKETGLILFLFIYYIEMIWLKITKYKDGTWKDAYRNTAFEMEAYSNQTNYEYLKTRKFWAWLKYFKKDES